SDGQATKLVLKYAELSFKDSNSRSLPININLPFHTLPEKYMRRFLPVIDKNNISPGLFIVNYDLLIFT
ncbi:MAG: hypothetical protein LUF35_06300, partial [Lachnospiraceae bacterium]|nr:hypothetical protein [Lachnospiraceae bacterium]